MMSQEQNKKSGAHSKIFQGEEKKSFSTKKKERGARDKNEKSKDSSDFKSDDFYENSGMNITILQ